MKKILGFTALLIMLANQSAKAQFTMHKLIHVGYVYQNQSFAELGGRLLFLENDDTIYRVGAAALLGSANGKFAVLPKIQGDILINFERNVDLYHSYYFLAGAEATTKYIAPKIGATLFGIIDLTGGYVFPIDKSGINGKELKGLNINFTLNLPLVMLNDLLKK
ncbi:hypothetical protein OK344_04235 [Kaistella sp. BT6-1-3]|uniref:Outer membrane protein beta-barrel domain-containing protein n=1 Tax=Kaistella yananensis TaxID=2989820 RepID=A0ABT3JKV0_9FLAO|nr:hypothetical protein [Kaistella yananensis]MCW4451410.1 hypothetical protein [Kaistella yananensis]